ncbi:alcohol dehydrogenase [Paramyrothecium foliicola]|nr:alcohol dehydrogenase [Paramyrothecium foliicola]
MPRALTLQHIEGGKPGEVYYPIQIKEVPKPSPGPHQVLVRLTAAALNHRDLFIRHHQYPAISFENPMLADGYGIVVEAGSSVTRSDLLNKPVILSPMRGWDSDLVGPEDPRKFAIHGGVTLSEVGTAQDYVVVHEDEVEPASDHLTPVEGAALPLVGLTAWRALVTKSGCASAGKNILITGIGGGVALQALQFAVAFGCNVFVTSGDQAKIDKAKALGARAGFIYKKQAWEKELKADLPKDRPFLDTIIDGAGGDIVSKAVKLLRPGGSIVQYGMTVSPKMTWSMPAVLSNIELKGSTMGSRKEFKDMIAFVNKNQIRPVVSRTIKGLDNIQAIDGLFAEMEEGKQFGKLVIEIDSGHGSPSKL